MTNPALACLVAIYAARLDSDALKNAEPGWIYKYQDTCLAASRSEYLRLVRVGEFSSAEKLLMSTATIYGADNEEVRSLLALGTRIKKLNEMIDEKNSMGIARALVYQENHEEETVLKEHASHLAQERIAQFLKERKPEEALSLVPFLNFEKRTPSQHELVGSILGSLRNIKEFVNQEAVVDMLVLFAAKDDQIKNQFGMK